MLLEADSELDAVYVGAFADIGEPTEPAGEPTLGLEESVCARLGGARLPVDPTEEDGRL